MLELLMAFGAPLNQRLGSTFIYALQVAPLLQKALLDVRDVIPGQVHTDLTFTGWIVQLESWMDILTVFPRIPPAAAELPHLRSLVNLKASSDS